MMRRGGRGSSLRGPRGRRDDAAIPSAVYFNRWWTARNCVCVTVLAACSLAISILIWSSRPGRASRPTLHGVALQSSNPGIVFPLYRYFRQSGNGSHGMGGCEVSWRANRAAGNGRRIREEGNALMNVHGGHRLNRNDMEHFYIQMRLGVPPMKYNFQIDTASGLTWVYSSIDGLVSEMDTWGPHGLFVPEDNSFVKCIGDTAALCQQFQASSGGIAPCGTEDNYRCLFVSRYADGSYFLGFVVNGSFTVAMEDGGKRSLFSVFGCVVEKIIACREVLPLTTDGLIGLGNCKRTLLDQWSVSKAIKQNILGVCLGKAVDWSKLPSPEAAMGYLSMGMDFKEKFDESNSVWSKLVDPGKMLSCAFAATLLSISFDSTGLTFWSAMVFDTGSDLTYMTTDLYIPLMETFDDYAMSKGYIRVVDNELFPPEVQRICWEPPGEILDMVSPVYDFLPLTFGFEGISSTSGRASLQYLIVQPVNYLVWDAQENKLCVNILEDAKDDGSSFSNLGVELMREHLFVYDIENQRVRWQSNNCELN